MVTPNGLIPDVLTAELGKIPTQRYYPDIDLPQGLYTGVGFFKRLQEYEKSHKGLKLWVMSYTFTQASLTCTTIPIECCIYQCGIAPPKTIPTKQHLNVHTKLVIIRQARKSIAAFIGSQNFVPPTNNNLMLEVERKYIQPLTNYFNLFWSAKI